MTIRTLVFASYRDIAGTDEVRVDLAPGATAADLVQRLRERGGGWERLPARPAIAVNLEYVPLSTLLSEGDEVALIPPVSGG